MIPVELASVVDALTPENLVNALSLGALYALIAVGYTMVYGIIKLINFAHGEIYMLGAVWALGILSIQALTGLNLFVALIPAMILCALVGMTVDWSAYLSLRRKSVVADWLSIALICWMGISAIFFKLTDDRSNPLFDETMHMFWLVMIIATPVVMALLALLEKRGLFGYPRAIKSDRINALITAIGMSLILQTLVQLILGATPKALPVESYPAFFNEQVFWLFGAPVLGKELAIWVVTLLMVVCLQWLVMRTKIGAAMRACSQDPEAAALMGVSVDKVIAVTFAIGSAMAAVAGVLYAAKVGGNIEFRMGYYPGLLAFAAAVLGGIGNIRGALLGGVLIGMVQAFSGKPSEITLPFVVMIIVLLVRPWGLLGKPETTRA
ncbi:MAG: branched-chain amino acid ABC transporter permease, partial [Planctomycetota bacterium]